MYYVPTMKRRLHIYLPEYVLEELEILKDDTGETISHLIRTAILKYLKAVENRKRVRAR